MRQLSILVPPPPLWLTILLNIIVLLFIIICFIVILCIKRRPFCVTPTESDLSQASSLRLKKGSPGKIVSRTQTTVKQGFSFKDHGDDIGTDMSGEERHLKPVEDNTALVFDPRLVAMNIQTAEQADEEPTQKRVVEEEEPTQKKTVSIAFIPQTQRQNETVPPSLRKSTEYDDTQRF
ncbi:hypothetical protein GCK32_003706 [Trichostrongylus colubriformis]|uniref:Uncharacterized protein n=1 Tax=Trichostrongylus colubriformis TaxID=6319 RepID=A0AAN8FWZ1_TRICO